MGAPREPRSGQVVEKSSLPLQRVKVVNYFFQLLDLIGALLGLPCWLMLAHVGSCWPILRHVEAQNNEIP